MTSLRTFSLVSRLLHAPLRSAGSLVWLLGMVCLLGCSPDAPAERVDLVAALEEADGSALVIWDLERDSAVVAIRPDEPLPVAGLPTLVTALAAEALPAAARQAARPASVLTPRRLPGLEPARRDTGHWTLDGLLDAGLLGDRAAADEALATVGRQAVEATAPADAEAPVPLGGLLLAWAPARRGSQASPDSLAATFVTLPRAAQRDSAFFRDRAFLNSAALRAAETRRLESRGLGLTAARHEETLRATLPRGSAHAYAQLLARHPALLARLAALPARDGPARTAAGRMGSFGAAASVSEDGRRVGVVIWGPGLDVQSPAAALAAALRNSGG